MKYRADIDGLRALAVLPVILFHAFPGRMPGGFIGVDIFFVISGFLISTIIFESLDKGKFSFSDFYKRRVKRIFPALLLVLISSLTFGWFALLTDEYRQLAKHAMTGIGFISNFILWNESGYFDNAAETKVLLHLWSLSVEEQFYVVWPLLCWIIWRKKIHIRTVMIFLIFGSFLLNISTLTSDSIEAFYSPITRFWELLVGAMLAHISIYNKALVAFIQQKTRTSSGISFIGLLFLGCGFILIDRDTSFPGYWALVPVIGAALIILAGPNSFINRHLLANKTAVFLGVISYPLYLWHWPILTFLRIVERDTPDKYLRLTALVISVILAWLTYYFIERRIRATEGFKSVIVLITLSAVITGSALGIYLKNGVPERKAVSTSEFSENVRYQFMGPLWAYTKNELCLSEYPYKHQDSLAWWFCMKSSKNSPSILLLGNSFANQLYPGFAHNPRFNHHSVLSIGTCSVGQDGSITDPGSPCYGSRAKEQADFIDEIIKDTASLKFAILDGLQRKPNAEYIDRVLNRIAFLEQQEIQVVVFVPHIKPGFDPKACFKSPLKDKSKSCVISSSKRDDILNDFNPLIKAIKDSKLGALVYDQNEVFCDRTSSKCSFIKDGLPLHRDENHTSEYASILLQDYFSSWAESNLSSIFDSSFLSNQGIIRELRNSPETLSTKNENPS